MKLKSKSRRSIITNSDGTFKNIKQIVNDIRSCNRLSTFDFNVIKCTAEDDLISFHHSLGMWIRNTYGLWDTSHPLHAMGYHPDDYSFEVIVLLHKTLNRS